MAKAVCTLYGDDATVYGTLVITQAHEDARASSRASSRA